MAYNFEGRRIIVTGAGGSIGRGIATRLAENGAKVYALDCNKETLDSLVKEVPTIEPIYQDLEDWSGTKETVSKLNDVTGLVNCAGFLTPLEKAVDTPKKSIDKCLTVNLLASINLMQVVGKKMEQSGKGGSIVNISSLGGEFATQRFLPYCVSKAGLNMATKVFALELGPSKVRVNSICPGMVDTGLLRRSLTDEVIKEAIKDIPIGRICKISDVVDYVLFLLSERSLMINGTVTPLDGGRVCHL